MWKEVAADRHGEIAVEREVIPLQRIPDHASSDDLALLRGMNAPSHALCAIAPCLH